jgi:hypothetical protein
LTIYLPSRGSTPLYKNWRSRRIIDTVLPCKLAGRKKLSDVELGFDPRDAVVQFDDLANQSVELHLEIVKSRVDTVESASWLLKRALIELN